jgi:hypothetical protein
LNYENPRFAPNPDEFNSVITGSPSRVHRILSEDGSEFILEAADEFDREVAELGQSEKFMSFLAERSQEPGSISLEELEQPLL